MDWLTTDQAAGRLGKSERRVRQMLDNGELAGQKVRRRWRVSAADVDRLCAANQLRDRPLNIRLDQPGMFSPAHDPTDRAIGRLEGRLEAIERRQDALEARLRRLEGGDKG